MSLPLSILDLAPVPEGTDDAPRRCANIVDLAQLGDELGYTRVWYAEHHGMPSIASSSPEVLIATSAAATTAHPCRLGRRHAAQPCAAARGRDLSHAQRAPSRPHRSRHRPRRRQRRADAERAALGRRQLFPAGDGRAAGLRAGQLSRRPSLTRRSAWCPSTSTLPPIFILGSSGASAAAAGELGVGYSLRRAFQRDARRRRPSMPIAPRSSLRRSSPSRTRSSPSRRWSRRPTRRQNSCRPRRR